MTVRASHPSVLTVFAERLASVRLPGKLLEDLHGKPLIYWVAERVRRFGLTDLVVATDSHLIADVRNRFGFPFSMTSSSCENGTERVYEVSRELSNYEHYMNVQGDEPLIRASVLKRMLQSTGMRDGWFNLAVSPLDRSSNDFFEAKVPMQGDGRVRFALRLPVTSSATEVRTFTKFMLFSSTRLKCWRGLSMGRWGYLKRQKN